MTNTSFLMKSAAAGLILTAAAATTLPAAHAQKYTARILPNPSGATHATARGTSNGTHVGYVWNTGPARLQGDPPADIHPDGQAALDVPRDSRAAEWLGTPIMFQNLHHDDATIGTFTFGAVPIEATQARAIEGDRIVGYGFYKDQASRGVEPFTAPQIWTNSGTMQANLGTPVHSKHFRAIGVDQMGRIAGWGITSTGTQTQSAFSWAPDGSISTDLRGGNAVARAFAIDGDNLTGYVRATSDSDPAQAALVPLGGGAFIDLHPTGYASSVALGAHAGQQVGYAFTGGWDNAFVWEGSKASGVYLIPDKYFNARAEAVRFRRQVGYATVWIGNYVSEGNAHAMVWASHSSRNLDLHSLLSGLPGGFVASRAYGIGEKVSMPGEGGDIVGEAVDANGHTQAVVWEAQPAALTALTSPGFFGSRITITVALDGWAPPAGARIGLSSSNARLRVPATVTIPDGTTTASCTVAADKYALGSSTATITATYKNVTRKLVVSIPLP